MQNKIKHDVYFAKISSSYDQFPYNKDTTILKAFSFIWTEMGLDAKNPFSSFLSKGSKVVIKPNWVMDFNPSGYSLECLVSHSSIIHYLINWCAIAMKGEGQIIIGDCPLQGCDFDSLMRNIHMDDILNINKKIFPKIKILVQDWRLLTIERKLSKKGRIKYKNQKPIIFEPDIHKAYVEIDLGKDSFLEDISDFSKHFRVTMYNPNPLTANHSKGMHKYLIREDILCADLLINLAKMKTHQKAGLTGAMKNLVGAIGHKSYLPHHIKGSYFSGGDSFFSNNLLYEKAENIYDQLWKNYEKLSSFSKRCYEFFYQILRFGGRLIGGENIPPGSWNGNETIWRTILDINHIIYFGLNTPKKIINVIDGIVAGEGEGPLSPLPKYAGLLIVGENPAYIDASIAKTMGYNISRIPLIYQSIYHRKSKFEGPFLECALIHFFNDYGKSKTGTFEEIKNLSFIPPKYWKRAMSPSTQEI
jgi:hypothetical protein